MPFKTCDIYIENIVISFYKDIYFVVICDIFKHFIEFIVYISAHAQIIASGVKGLSQQNIRNNNAVTLAQVFIY